MRSISNAVIGSLTSLRELRVANNRLAALPPEIGSLSLLRKLVADNNLITSIPGQNAVLPMMHCMLTTVSC